MKSAARFDFAGQTAVVTGGTRGLGRAISLAFLASGARVLATYRADEDGARVLRELAGEHSGRLALARFDVASPIEVEAFWERVEAEEQGGVQVLVNNAGLRRDGLLAAMEPAAWDQVLGTNLGGGFLMSRGAVRNMMRRRYGRILFITSPAGRQGFEGQTNYAASKAGQVGLMRALCKEVAGRKITVNCVSPGFVDTELIADLPEELRRRYQESVPLRRFGTPEEVAYAVLALAAPEAAYISGATLEVCGGL